MYNLSLTQAEGITRDQLREQIKAQVREVTTQARQAAIDAREAAREAGAVQGPGQPGAPGAPGAPGVPAPGAPVGVPIIADQPPWADLDIPPRAKDVSIAFFFMFAAIIIALPIMRAIGKRIERGAPVAPPIPPQMQAQMEHLMQSVDAIAIEVERISEGQRFAAKLLAERSAADR